MKQSFCNACVVTCALALVQLAGMGTAAAAGRGNNEALGVIYVSGQGLYYDTFATTSLPPRGKFQQLYPVGETGYPTTAYGPGDPGYVGGRWWIDTDADGEQDSQDTYFSCPLLGPGRATP